MLKIKNINNEILSLGQSIDWIQTKRCVSRNFLVSNIKRKKMEKERISKNCETIIKDVILLDIFICNCIFI